MNFQKAVGVCPGMNVQRVICPDTRHRKYKESGGRDPYCLNTNLPVHLRPLLLSGLDWQEY